MGAVQHWKCEDGIEPEWYTKETKTKKGNRIIVANEGLVEYLAKIREEQKNYPESENDFVCRTESGEPLKNDTVSSRFGIIMEKHGINLRFHGLRHTFATLALMEYDQKIKTISEMLGHHSTAFTQDVYVKIELDHQRPVAEAFNGFFAGQDISQKSQQNVSVQNERTRPTAVILEFQRRQRSLGTKRAQIHQI